MRDFIFIMVFSVVLLFFAIYPAIKIVEIFSKNKKLSQRTYNTLTIIVTIVIALIGGLFLRYF